MPKLTFVASRFIRSVYFGVYAALGGAVGTLVLIALVRLPWPWLPQAGDSRNAVVVAAVSFFVIGAALNFFSRR